MSVAVGMLLIVGSGTPTAAGIAERDDQVGPRVEQLGPRVEQLGPRVEQLDPRIEFCIVPVVYRGGPLESCPAGPAPELGVVPIQPDSAGR